MISDIEVADGDGEFRPLGGAPDGPAPIAPEPLRSEGDGPRTPRRTALRWAAAGALAASLAWGGAAWALWPSDGRPDDGGYTVGAGLCDQFRSKALVAALGTREGDQVVDWSRDALDRAECAFTLRPPGPDVPEGDNVSSGTGHRIEYEVQLVAELHRVTDPRVEFEATRDVKLSGWPEQGYKVAEVPGVGDRAYLLDRTVEPAKELRVLDGGLVVRLQIVGYSTSDDGGPPPDGKLEEPDLAGIEPMLISDTRSLLDALREKPR